ncbi:MAG: hypothetical protein QM582_05595 [Micropruina sp.]|uniref:DUF7933 domain-containing protein n=1 Tax=Micropruina sp. TaxID=2737536 RepID=UPI0039E4046C
MTIVRNGETHWQSPATIGYSTAYTTLPSVSFDCATPECGLTPTGGFEMEALGGTTFSNAVGGKLTFGSGLLSGVCAVQSTTRIRCTLDLPTFVAEGTVIQLARPGVALPAGTTTGTALVRVSPLVDTDTNSTTTIVLRDPGPADNGDWAPRSKRVLVPDNADRTPQLAYDCLEPVCLSGPASGFRIEAMAGATFSGAVGGTTAFGSGTLAGVCTVESATVTRCALSAAREVTRGGSVVLPRLGITLPSDLPPLATVFRTSSVAEDANPANDPADYRVFGADLLADRLVIAEDFEHGQGTGSTSLTDYTGAPPGNQTYTADPAWLVTCNGTIQSFELTATTLPTCADASATADLKDLSWALGAFRAGLDGNGADPSGNHALSSYTGGNLPAGQQTVLSGGNGFDVTPGHYYTTSFDVAARSCTVRGASYFLGLIDADGTVDLLNEDAIDPCLVYQQVVTDPRRGSNYLGRYFAEDAHQATGSTLRFRVRNTEIAGSGNDSGIDNLAVYDVTPTLGKSFAPASGLATGQSTVLTFSIENSAELGGKAGWRLSDTLPDGLVVADDAAVDSTCQATTVTATPGATTIAAVGSLATGSSGCTISVSVVAASLGTFSNCAANMDVVGLIGPSSCAEVSYTIDNRPTPTPTPTATATPTPEPPPPPPPTEPTTPTPAASTSPDPTTTPLPPNGRGQLPTTGGGPGLESLLAGLALIGAGGIALLARESRRRR